MNRVTPEAPELLALKLQLSIDTRVDPYALANWIRDNQDWINASLAYENVATSAHPDYRHELYAWACLEWKRYAAARTPQSQLAPIIPTVACCASSSVAEPVESFLRRAWRRFR